MIYQVFIGRWQGASIISNRGHVIDCLVSRNWEKLKHLGFRSIYLLGVFDYQGPISVSHEEGKSLTEVDKRMPSPFAIRDHRSIYPDLGSIDSLRRLIQTLHQVGLKVILDFVPNHRSLNHIWTHSHPDFFVYNRGQLVREFSGDVVKLNYDNSQLRHQMIQTLATIASWGVDGVRCDMAHYIPLEFWEDAIRLIRDTYPSFDFIGEVYPDNPYDLSIYNKFTQVGFSGLYHGVLFNNLRSYLNGNFSLQSLIDHLHYIVEQPFAGNLVNYAANHDDVLPQYSEYYRVLTSLIQLLPGKSLFYNGSLNGLPHRLAHHLYEELPYQLQEVEYTNPELSNIWHQCQQIKLPLVSFREVNQTCFVGETRNSLVRVYFNFGSTPIIVSDLNQVRITVPAKDVHIST